LSYGRNSFITTKLQLFSEIVKKIFV